jgi:branched-chain amino acid aminotransferase
MYNWIFLDGDFIQRESASINLSNRSFNYGDALFESIRIINGTTLFFDDHWERLKHGMGICGMQSEERLSALNIRNVADELIQKNKVKGGRLKLLVYRDAEGFYSPVTDEVKYFMSINETEHDCFVWNNKGLQAGLYTAIKKPHNLLAEIKSTSALMYVLAARDARESGWDEIFLLNESGFLCEGSSSSVFLVDENQNIHTPALNHSPLPGVMRKNVIRLIRESGIKFTERAIAAEELLTAREVFVTNAIQGIRWVVSYREKRYFNTIGKKVFQLLLNEIENLRSI